jgi:polysaccharide biosynthesis transport protein
MNNSTPTVVVPNGVPNGVHNNIIPIVPTPGSPSSPPPEQNEEFSIASVISAVRRRWGIVAGTAIISAIYSITTNAYVAPTYQERFRILVEPVDNNNQISKLTTGKDAVDPQSGLDYDTQIQVLQNPELIGQVVKNLKRSYPKLSYAKVIEGLKISKPGRAKLLEVRYQSTDPVLIQAVLAQLAQIYLDYSTNQRQTNLRQGMQFVDQQMPLAQLRVDQLQKDLQRFRLTYNFIDPNTQAQQVNGQSSSLEQQQLALDQALVQARANYDNAQNELGAIASLENNPQYQNLVGQLRQIEVEIITESSRFGEQSLRMQALREKQTKLLPLLQQAAQGAVGSRLATIAAEIQSLEVQKQALAQTQAQTTQKFRQLPGLSLQYNELLRDLEFANANLNRFRTARETFQIQAAQTEIPWQIVEPPTRTNQVISQNPTTGVISGILAGLAAGVVLVVLLDKLTNTYQSTEELKKKVQLPILGSIPIHPQLQENSDQTPVNRSLFNRLTNLTALTTPNPLEALQISSESNTYVTSQFVESLRILYSNLELTHPSNAKRSLIISSAQPGDGKTTIAVQLALTAAAMGKKVLLVDADLRQPTVHTQLNLENNRGLNEIITANLSVKDVMQTPDQLPRCRVITAGRSPADPAQLLTSAHMRHLANEFQKNFDLVIYDSPPLVGLADASLMAPYTGGILLVVGIGKTKQNQLNRALDDLKSAQIPILGIVANRLM